MDLMKWWRIAWISAVAGLVWNDAGLADVRLERPDAELIHSIQRAADKNLLPNQILRITGEITSKDVKDIRSIFEDLGDRLRFQEQIQLMAVLDSGGGSFKAGIQIAQEFKRIGIPTLVPAGGACLSACAVIFMAGTRISMGGEGGIAPARMVIMPSELGFHRPFLPDISSVLTPDTISQVPPEEIAALFEDEFRSAFNAANELIQEMLAVDPDAWASDLLLRMLTAKQSADAPDFVRLQTIQDALRWEIDVLGLTPPALGSAQNKFDVAFALCFNRGPQIRSSIERFWPDPSALEREYEFNMRDAPRMYPGMRDASGRKIAIFIHHESPMGCEITFDGASARLKVGQFEANDPIEVIDVDNGFGVYLGHHPYTPLERISNRPPAMETYRCMVLAGSNVLDNDPCTYRPEMRLDNELVELFTWPSGARTVLQTKGVSVRLNGGVSTPIAARPTGMQKCLRSSETGRTFCYGKL